MAWLAGHIEELPEHSPQNIQATLAEFTAKSIVWGIHSSEVSIAEVYICGGGAHNTDLMRRLYRMLEPMLVANTSAIGIASDWVEAAAFGWLARQTLEGLAGNAPVVTGARGSRVLGGVYPGKTA
jgi:anhydro-N-acetylmuramic acid kinase